MDNPLNNTEANRLNPFNSNTPDLTFYKNIEVSEINKRIREFRRLDIRKMSIKEICDAIYKVLLFNNQFMYFPQSRNYPSGTKFFRVRKLDGTKIPNKNLMTLDDFWSPPSCCIKKYGRLNKPGESLLYTVPLNPLLAKMEARIEDGSFFSVIVYESLAEIKVNCIGLSYDYNKMGITDAQCILIHDIINDFFVEEFSRDVGIGTEYLYQVSELIAKNFFDLPPRDFQDAWGYPSLFSKSDYNICFRPDIAQEKLELKGALIAKNDISDAIHVHLISHGFNENGIALYYELGSDVQKKVFPDIVR